MNDNDDGNHSGRMKNTNSATVKLPPADKSLVIPRNLLDLFLLCITLILVKVYSKWAAKWEVLFTVTNGTKMIIAVTKYTKINSFKIS